ncbi:MAG: hypothetical protein PW792_14160 [Acidobacteriaceae bacterium]|nr:hypothetical protein [Acidobacteriaceae bacterium]
MRKIAFYLSAAFLLVALVLGSMLFRRVNSTLRASRSRAALKDDLPFSLRPFTHSTAPAFEQTGFSSTATAVVELSGKLYIASPSGLAVYDTPSAPPRQLRLGIDLPPERITGLAVAHLRGHPASQVLGITSGAGLLLFDTNAPPQQLLAADPSSRTLTAILPLATGDLLLGTQHAGVLLFDGTHLRRVSPATSHLDVTALAGNETEFWIGTRNQGLLHWHSGQLTTLNKDGGLPDNTILSMADTPRGLFVGTPLGVAEIIGDHVSRQLARGLFASTLSVNQNSLVIGSPEQSLLTVPLAAHAVVTGTPLEAATLLPTPDAAFAVSQGKLLRATSAGLWQTVLTLPPGGLSDSDVTALNFSTDGRLWIGYFDHGLDVLELSTQRVQHLENDHLFCINRIVNDPSRRTVDVATANGLVLLDAAARPQQVLTRQDGLASDQITDIAFSADGLTLATPSGLTVLTPSGAQTLSSFNGLANNHVYALSADPASTLLLAGTLAGVSVVDHMNIASTLSLQNSALPRNWITAIVRTSAAEAPPRWLVGTYGGSVVEVDAQGHVTKANTPAPDAVINPNAMLATPTHLFAGTLSQGLLAYNRSTQHWTQITNGLPSLNVTAFASHGGELYIGTTNGIVHVPEQDLP